MNDKMNTVAVAPIAAAAAAAPAPFNNLDTLSWSLHWLSLMVLFQISKFAMLKLIIRIAVKVYFNTGSWVASCRPVRSYPAATKPENRQHGAQLRTVEGAHCDFYSSEGQVH